MGLVELPQASQTAVVPDAEAGPVEVNEGGILAGLGLCVREAVWKEGGRKGGNLERRIGEIGVGVGGG